MLTAASIQNWYISLLQRKANWQEKKGLFLASFPHLHSTRQSCFEPSNYPQFIILMTTVKGKAKKSFWTGLTSKEVVSAKETALRPMSVPWVFRECFCPFFSCPKGLHFCLSSWSYTCIHRTPATSPVSAVGLPSLPATWLATCHHHGDGAAGPSQLLFPLIAVLLYLSECGLLPPPTQAGEEGT